MNEAALKERLKSIASTKGVTVNEVWKQLLLERFLARLAQSGYQDKFIFKGGLLLAQYLIIGRETTDADFLMRKLSAESTAVAEAMRVIAAEEAGDGFQFNFSSVEELPQPHMDYPGFRVSLNAKYGNMTDKIQIDIGVGDLVDEVENSFLPCEYRGKPMFAGEISLLAYPPETIFSEKLETILNKGATNSRMKDYHDVILMTREAELLDLRNLKKAVQKTFANRGTRLSLPIEFDRGDLSEMQKLWARHLNGLGRFKEELGLPALLADVLREINTWLADNKISSAS